MTLQGSNISSKSGEVVIVADKDITVPKTTETSDHINVASLNNSLGSIVSHKALTIDAQGAIDNSRQGYMEANSGLQVTAQSLNNQTGKILNIDASDMSITKIQNIDNQSGTIGSNGKVDISAQTLNNQNGKVIAQGNLAITTLQGADNTSGTIFAKQNLNINQSNTNLNNTNGSIGASKNVIIQALATTNTSGKIVADQDVQLTTQNLNGDGKIQAGQDMTLHLTNDVSNLVSGEITANRDLAITADTTDDYTEKNQNSGFGFSTGATGGITGSIGQGKTDSTYNSVTGQAGIIAGKEGFDITVGKNTDLKGAVIASEATPDKNILTTDTLTYSDIQNNADYSSSSTGIGYSSKDGFKPTPGMPVSGDADSTTKSAIALGTITITGNQTQDFSGLSRDPSGALNALGKIFDKKTVQEQQELAKVFGEEAFKLVGDIAQKHQKEKFNIDIEVSTSESKAKKADENGNVEEANKLRNQVVELKVKVEELSIWDEGGKAKIALHALVGGIMSTMGSGSFASGALSAGINESLQNEINKLPTELRSFGSAVIGTVVSEVVGGDGQIGATITTSAAENNTAAHVWLVNEAKNILTGTLIDYGASWVTGEDFDLMQSILANSSYNDVVQVCAKIKSGDYIGAMEHTIALGSNVGFGKNVEKLNQFSEKVSKFKGANNLQWTNHGYKHYPSKNVDWKDVVKSTTDGPAKYTPGTNVEGLERKVWAEGVEVTNGKNWKVMELDDVVGASGGKETKYIRVEESGGTIHGHPITEEEFRKLTK